MIFFAACDADKLQAGNYCEPSMLNIPESPEGTPHPAFHNPTYCDTATSPQNAERDFSNPLYTESSEGEGLRVCMFTLCSLPVQSVQWNP